MANTKIAKMEQNPTNDIKPHLSRSKWNTVLISTRIISNDAENLPPQKCKQRGKMNNIYVHCFLSKLDTTSSDSALPFSSSKISRKRKYPITAARARLPPILRHRRRRRHSSAMRGGDSAGRPAGEQTTRRTAIGCSSMSSPPPPPPSMPLPVFLSPSANSFWGLQLTDSCCCCSLSLSLSLIIACLPWPSPCSPVLSSSLPIFSLSRRGDVFSAGNRNQGGRP